MNLSDSRFSSRCWLFQGECDPALGSEFQFTVHSKELIIGEIFVRIYNEQPTFPLEVSVSCSLIQNTHYVLLIWRLVRT